MKEIFFRYTLNLSTGIKEKPRLLLLSRGNHGNGHYDQVPPFLRPLFYLLPFHLPPPLSRFLHHFPLIFPSILPCLPSISSHNVTQNLPHVLVSLPFLTFYLASCPYVATDFFTSQYFLTLQFVWHKFTYS